MLLIALLNLFVNFVIVLTVPLALTLAAETVVGFISSVASAGMLLGAAPMSI